MQLPITDKILDDDRDSNDKIPNIPFEVGLYGVTSRTLIVGINGYVSPGSRDSGAYTNGSLPNDGADVPSWVPYWSDLYIYSGTAQGIYQQIDGDENHRTLSIEFFMSFYGASSSYTHFMVTLFEEDIGRVVFSYFQTASQKPGGQSNYGTIGVQRPATGEYNQYSFNVQPREGLTIEWRPSTNQWRDVSTGTC
ncbi:hypothetical protein DPSP01_000665 [Paraphaeosphaeria sporulosa]|uniref:Uncharacterized protein n=1 Tax=Paraphaeosphaeria sporulosa TaxID=1460663 RepID=A0A177CRM1_9PLEO|nr:uncharacterized protein CC84DRAFT_1213028 [Paraphaeosphaeria sporulosa]OAG09618.1 hypothetical protein CC84DRAFT_1213028 [Paraphaeosphaeria sporulosa]